MDLKNALAVCLIALFASTLVVMLARWLDLQAAARIEPQLAAIVEELQALRKEGGLTAATGDSATRAATENGLVVYYFHGNKRCPTCEVIESQTHAVVQEDFAAELGRNAMAWKILNYEQPSGKKLAKEFDVQMAVVVLAKMKDGRIAEWKRLDEVWGLWNDKPAFAAFLRGKIEGMLEKKSDANENPPPATPIENPADLPLPTTDH